MRYTLTLQELHLKQLSELSGLTDTKKGITIALCGMSRTANDLWDGGPEIRFLSKDVIHILDEEIVESGEKHGILNSSVFQNTIQRAKNENLAICLVNSQPIGDTLSSDTNALSESIFNYLHKETGSTLGLLNLLIAPDGQLTAHVYSAQKHHVVKLIRVLGDRFSFFYDEKLSSQTREEFDRQALALGPALTTDLSKLRIAVVGCGATGSATAHLLARLGVGQLLLIDKDVVERSNLSRLYGARTSDADLGQPKAQILAAYLANIGIGCRIRYFTTWVGDSSCRDALKSCDIVFSCTDDNSGRIFLNRLSYFYLIPVFDMGISIDPLLKPEIGLHSAQGRFTVLQPGNTCLMCRNVVNRALAHEEQLKRNDPDGYERLKEEAYVTGSGNPSPAVITFTSEVATMSVNELINRLTGFKKLGPEHHVVRFFDQGVDRRPPPKDNPDCPICKEQYYWGRGDITPFLDQINQ